MRFSLESVEDDPSATVLVRGFMEEANVESVAAAPSNLPGVRAIYADPLIETCPITCINSPAVGDTAGVASAVCVSKLRTAGMTGAGVLLAIVDTGINLPYLRSRGLNPNFNSSRSWVPVIPGQPPLVPGNLPVDHGTMCAFDALIAAPDSMLVDIAVLQSRRPGRTVMEGLLSDAVLAYSFLHQILSGPRRPGDFHSMVVSNSWGMFRRQWDFPVGHPGNYSDNPNHPFNRIVGRLAQAGADILFAEAIRGEDDVRRLPALLTRPALINIVIGGQTPVLPVSELAACGYGCVLYANAALQGAVRGMQAALGVLRSTGRLDEDAALVTPFAERQRLVDKPLFDELENRYV
jgi:hypothetical protein